MSKSTAEREAKTFGRLNNEKPVLCEVWNSEDTIDRVPWSEEPVGLEYYEDIEDIPYADDKLTEVKETRPLSPTSSKNGKRSIELLINRKKTPKEENIEEEIDIDDTHFGVSNKRDDGTWRWRNAQFLLTYETHIDKDLYPEFMENLAEEHGRVVEELYIAHEIGKKGSKRLEGKHSHVYVKFDTTLISSDKSIFNLLRDPEDEDKGYLPMPNVKNVKKGMANEYNVKYYLTKEDKSEDLVELAKTCVKMSIEKKFHLGGGKSAKEASICIAEMVWACDTYKQALKLVTSKMSYTTITGLWQDKEAKVRPKILFKSICDWTWQVSLREMLLEPKWDHRMVHWIVDPPGCGGKTTFADYFCNNYGGIYLSNIAGASHIATLVSGHINSGGSCKYIFIDLPRAATDFNIYDTLEALLNGKMTVMKWHGKVLTFDKPRVVVFSNWNPPFDPKAILEAIEANKKTPSLALLESANLSRDRWHIGDIVNITKETGKDKVIKWRPNPFKVEFVRPNHFDHLPDDMY